MMVIIIIIPKLFLTGSSFVSIKSVVSVTAVSGYTTHTQCWVRVGDGPLVRERDGHTTVG